MHAFICWFSKNRLFAGALCLVSLGVILTSIRHIPSPPTHPKASLEASMIDVDIYMLVTAIESKSTFANTFDWWTESWTLMTEYWRPLTMQTLWLQWHTFGYEKIHLFFVVSVILNLIYLGLFGMATYYLTRNRWIALASVFLFGCTRFYLPPLSFLLPDHELFSPSSALLTSWKDQPDLWTDCLIMGALLASLTKRWWAALLCTGLAICFKESGWLTFPMILIVLGFQGQLKSIPKWVYGAGLGMSLVLLALRWSAGPKVFVGYRLGRNLYWYLKYNTAVGGMLSGVVLGSTGSFVMALVLFALFFLWKPKSPIIILLGLISAFATNIAVIMLQKQVGWDVAGVLSFSWETSIVPCLIALFWIAGIFLLWKTPWARHSALASLLLGCVAATQYAAAAHVRTHVLYLADSFQTIFLVLILASYLCAIREWLPRLRHASAHALKGA